MAKVFVLLETYKGRKLVVTASTNGRAILKKARDLAKKADRKGSFAPVLSPFAEGDLSEKERKKRGYEYEVGVFDSGTLRPYCGFRISSSITWRFVKSSLAKISLHLPVYR